MIHEIKDFSGGETTLSRVPVGAKAVLGRCSGFDPSDGALSPEMTAAKINTGPGLGAVCEQTPFVFNDGTASIIACNADGEVCELASGIWSSGGGSVHVLPESIPVRQGRQVVFPGGGANPILAAYEPGSPSTKLRPLSLKSPVDYVEGARPLVTPVSSGVVRLFDCEDSSPWCSTDSHTTKWWDVDNTGTDKAVFTFTSNTTTGTRCFTKILNPGVDLTGKQYLILDLMVQGDPQKYDCAGLFPNDSAMLPSGYEIGLFSDAACTSQNLIVQLRIPALLPLGKVNRIAIALPKSAVPARGIAIFTSSFFIKPASGTTYALTVYSGGLKTDWSHISNCIAPAITFGDSPLVSQFEQIETGNTVSAPINNVISDPSFEQGTLHWSNIGIDPDIVSGNTFSGVKGLVLDDPGEGVYQNSIPTVANTDYWLEIWEKGPENYTGGAHFEIQPKLGGSNVGQLIRIPTTGSIDTQPVWHKFKVRFAMPAGTDNCKLSIIQDGGSRAVFHYLDDVAMYQADRTSPLSTYVLQTFAETGTDRIPENPLVRYCYVFCGKNLLGSPSFVNMVSNPSDPSQPDLYADPWSTMSLSIELPGTVGARVTDEYGDYVTHVLIYRQIYDGSVGTWSQWTLLAALPVKESISFVDTGSTDKLLPNGASVPSVLEITNDFASSARYAMVADHRVYAGCLDWDSVSGKWMRPTAIQVSGYDKPWAFSTVVDDASLCTDGGELDGYAVNGSEIRGIIARGDEKYVFLDNEFFLLRGDNPITGWQFVRLDSIGCRSARTLADCRSMIIWHDGNHFYAYAGGLAQPISRFKIDSSQIDWDAPHNAVYWQDKYVFFCRNRDGEGQLMIYDFASSSWRIRQSEALNLLGICNDGSNGRVYGINAQGDAVDLFGSVGIDGSTGSAVREVWTQYLVIADPSKDVQIREAIIEAVTDQPEGVELSMVFDVQGAKNNSSTRVLKIAPDRTRYSTGVNLQGNAIRIRVRYEGINPPVIYSLGVVTDEVGAR